MINFHNSPSTLHKHRTNELKVVIKLIRETYNNPTIIINGDFNTDLRSQDTPFQKDLQKLNLNIHYDETANYTRISSNNRGYIDFIISTPQNIKSVKVKKPEHSIISDHLAIEYKTNLNCRIINQVHKKFNYAELRQYDYSDNLLEQLIS